MVLIVIAESCEFLSSSVSTTSILNVGDSKITENKPLQPIINGCRGN